MISLATWIIKMREVPFIYTWFIRQRYEDWCSGVFRYVTAVVYFIYHFVSVSKSTKTVWISITISYVLDVFFFVFFSILLLWKCLQNYSKNLSISKTSDHSQLAEICSFKQEQQQKNKSAFLSFSFIFYSKEWVLICWKCNWKACFSKSVIYLFLHSYV